MTLGRWLLTTLAFGLAVGPVAAEDRSPVGIVQKTVGELQRRREGGGPIHFDLSPADHVVSGDQVVYTVEIRNTTSAPIEGALAVTAVPDKMIYLDGSASGPGCDIEFSVDGGVSFGKPGELTIKLPAGQSRRAVAADYTHVRWRLKYALSGMSTAYAHFRAVLK